MSGIGTNLQLTLFHKSEFVSKFINLQNPWIAKRDKYKYSGKQANTLGNNAKIIQISL